MFIGVCNVQGWGEGRGGTGLQTKSYPARYYYTPRAALVAVPGSCPVASFDLSALSPFDLSALQVWRVAWASPVALG